jgi:Domain of unknown function DUF1829/Domain of unknown function DUF1828
MIADIQKLLDDYAAWLKDKTTLRQVNDTWIQITTPYLDRHNDYIQIYAKRQNGGFLLTDDGEVIADLELSGCKLDSPKRKDLLKQTLNGFGVQLHGDRILEAHASSENFALRKHGLVQAMLAVNDLFFLAEPMVASLFYEDVVAWLDLSEIRYSPNVKFTGKSGFDNLFDFLVPKSRSHPERILQTVNRPTKETAQKVILSWIDTKDVRPLGSHAYAILNDSEHGITPGVIDALRNYEVKPVLWSQRDSVKEELAA